MPPPPRRARLQGAALPLAAIVGLLLLLCPGPGVSKATKLRLMLQKREGFESCDCHLLSFQPHSDKINGGAWLHLMTRDVALNCYASCDGTVRKDTIMKRTRRALENFTSSPQTSAPVLMKEEMSVKEDKAKEFLNNLKRQKRQLWDRSQPDVQQWYQHFLYLGFDEAKFEDYVSYWSNVGHGGHEYDGGYYHHHYDEDAPIGPRNPDTFRHGANVNYDYYY